MLIYWAPLARALSRWVTSPVRACRVSASARVRTRNPALTSRWILSKSLIGSLILNQAAAGCSGVTRHEHHAVSKCPVSFEVAVAHGAFVVEREHDEPADLIKGRPALSTDRLGEGREPAANPVRRENLGRGRTPRGSRRRPSRAPRAEGHGAGRQAGDGVVLELDQDQDGDMARFACDQARICFRASTNVGAVDRKSTSGTWSTFKPGLLS